MNEDELDHDGPTIYDLQLEVAASRELAKKAETEAKALKQQLADEQSQHAQLQDAKAGTPSTGLVCETIASVLVDKNGKRTVELGKEKQLEEMNPDVFASLYGAALKKIFPNLFDTDKAGDATQEKKASS